METGSSLFRWLWFYNLKLCFLAGAFRAWITNEKTWGPRRDAGKWGWWFSQPLRPDTKTVASTLKIKTQEKQNKTKLKNQRLEITLWFVSSHHFDGLSGTEITKGLIHVPLHLMTEGLRGDSQWCWSARYGAMRRAPVCLARISGFCDLVGETIRKQRNYQFCSSQEWAK